MYTCMNACTHGDYQCHEIKLSVYVQFPLKSLIMSCPHTDLSSHDSINYLTSNMSYTGTYAHTHMHISIYVLCTCLHWCILIHI